METSGKTVSRAKKPAERGQSAERYIIKKSILIVVVLLILALIDAQYGIFSALRSNAQAKGRWQAVFLTNNQVYFGHLSSFGLKYFKLTDVYYIRSAQVPVTPAATPEEGANATQPQFETRNELVKMTDDAHGPENELYIPKQQILFWQTLRQDSNIVRTIGAAR